MASRGFYGTMVVSGWSPLLNLSQLPQWLEEQEKED